MSRKSKSKNKKTKKKSYKPRNGYALAAKLMRSNKVESKKLYKRKKVKAPVKLEDIALNKQALLA